MARHRPDMTETTCRSRYQRPFEFRHAAPKKGKRKLRSPWWAKLCVIIGVVLMTLSTTAYGAQWFLTQRYEKNIHRANLLGDTAGGGGKVDGPLTFLILGTDKRTEEDFDPNDESSRTWAVDGERADTIMLVHMPKEMDKAYVVSIPRDSDVDIPEYKDYAGGKDKINAAYFFGGAPLMVKTVNHLLGIKVDYPIIVNFKAVREITDAVGGITVKIDQESYDPRTKRTWTAGEHRLNGKDAEAYVRQRYGLDGSDYDRQKRQQQFINALTQQIDAEGMTSSPAKLDKLLRVVTDNITVDHTMPVKELAFAFKQFRPGNLTYLKFPMAGSEQIDGIWYEFVDEMKATELGTAMDSGDLDQFIAANPELLNDPTHGS